MISKETVISDLVNNGDGTRSMIAEVNVYLDGVLKWQDSRSYFTFPDTMTNQEIIDSLNANEYSIYY